MGEGAQGLDRLVRDELSRETTPAARRIARAIAERIGPAAAAVVFYGSCLRKQTDEGVFDFYALVDDYASASTSAVVARLGAWLPPNVFYLEVPGAEAGAPTLRAKYAVVSLDDFGRMSGEGSVRTGIWARFCQPARAVWVRDDAACEALVAGCSRAIVTAARTAAPFLEGPFTPEDFWQRLFAETYAAEMRAESPETVRTLFDADPERYARAAREGLAELERRGELVLRSEGDRWRVEMPAEARRRATRRWSLRRRRAKAAYVAQLIKTAFTFGDWLPYALWKVERHTGVHFEASERQRRHPLIFGWPLLFRVLRQRALR